MSLDFQIALSGIRAGETMIQVAQNNIANASNTSYARQRVEVSAADYPSGNSGIPAQLGNGVIVEEINRIRNELLIQQSRTENGKIGYYTGASDVLSNIETIFNEVGENSVSDLMLNFFNSFEEVGKFPEQNSYRLSAVYSGKMLAEKLRGISEQLDEVKEQTDVKITTEAAKINDLLSKIANVHHKMENVYSDKANALMDERDKYLDELSTYLDVQIVHKSNPINMEIKVGNATLLSGKKVYDIEPMYVSETDKWVLGASDVEFKPSSGSLSGLIYTRNEYIERYENDLNDLASNFIDQVNTIHSTGFGLDGSTGMRFFLGSDIRTIEVDPVFEQTPEKLAISVQSGVVGNSDIAQTISGLKEQPFMNGRTPINYYQAYTVRLASDLNVAKENGQIHTEVQKAMESQRQAVQGVNVDEEMTDLMLFQKYYQANAKTLKMNSELMDQLLSII